MTDSIKKETHISALDEFGSDPSSASANSLVEEDSDCQGDGSEEGECKKGAWTVEEDKELSRLIDVSKTQA